MVLVYILLLIPLTTATRRFDGPSYRSNVMEGDKPILRMGPEADDSEDESTDEYRQPSLPVERKAPESPKNMKRVVNWLVDHFSYDLAAVRRSIDGAQDKPAGLLSEPLSENETDEINSGADKPVGLLSEAHNENENDEPNSAVWDGDKPASDEASKETDKSDSESEETGLRTHKKKHKEEKGDPDWIVDLKAFIKDLTTQYGQHEVLDKTKPVIASLEKKHHMKIKDIDVDEYGEIHITYIETGKKKTTRKRKDTDYR